MDMAGDSRQSHGFEYTWVSKDHMEAWRIANEANDDETKARYESTLDIRKVVQAQRLVQSYYAELLELWVLGLETSLDVQVSVLRLINETDKFIHKYFGSGSKHFQGLQNVLDSSEDNEQLKQELSNHPKIYEYMGMGYLKQRVFESEFHRFWNVIWKEIRERKTDQKKPDDVYINARAHEFQKEFTPKNTKVFFASPTDVVVRQELILKLPSTFEQHYFEEKSKSRIVIRHFEQLPPQPGDPQALIDREQLLKCQILVAVFYETLGTPVLDGETGEVLSPSGTAWEVGIAHNSFQENGRPVVMIYNKEDPPNVDHDYKTRDNRMEEWKRKEEYIKSISHLGLYKTYQSTAKLEYIIARDICAVITKHFPNE